MIEESQLIRLKVPRRTYLHPMTLCLPQSFPIGSASFLTWRSMTVTFREKLSLHWRLTITLFVVVWSSAMASLWAVKVLQNIRQNRKLQDSRTSFSDRSKCSLFQLVRLYKPLSCQPSFVNPVPKVSDLTHDSKRSRFNSYDNDTVNTDSSNNLLRVVFKLKKQ